MHQMRISTYHVSLVIDAQAEKVGNPKNKSANVKEPIKKQNREP
jgi:ferritin